MYELIVEMTQTELGVGAYQRPRVYLTDPANEDFKSEVESPVWELSGISGYLLNAPAGFVIFVATAISTGRIYARTTIDGNVLEGYIDVSIIADYDWGIIESGETETPTDLRDTVNFAKYSGFNKGVRRPFGSGETVYMQETVQTLSVPAAGDLDLITPFIVGSQSFTENNIESYGGFGFGLTPFGTREETP